MNPHCSHRFNWRLIAAPLLVFFACVLSFCIAPLPTLVLLVLVWLLATIRALFICICRLPRWGIEVADRLHWWCDREGYLTTAARRGMRLEGFLSGFHYSAFVACCREVRSEHQQTLFCCQFAGHVRQGLVSEEDMNDLLEQSTWPDAHLWVQRFLHDPFLTVGGADFPRA